MTKTIHVREVYLRDLNGKEFAESYPIGEGKVIEGREPDKYGVYEQDIYWNWLADFNTLYEAEKFKNEQIAKISQEK